MVKQLCWIVVLGYVITGCVAPVVIPTPKPRTPTRDFLAGKTPDNPPIVLRRPPTKTPTPDPCDIFEILNSIFAGEEGEGCPNLEYVTLPDFQPGTPDYANLPADPSQADFPKPPWVGSSLPPESPSLAEAYVVPHGSREVFKLRIYGKEYGSGWIVGNGYLRGVIVDVCFEACNQLPPALTPTPTLTP